MNMKNQGFTPKLIFRKLIFIICFSYITACQSPHEIFEKKALALTLTSQVVKTTSFSHKVYKNAQRTNGKLHIYLTGDGLPWMEGVVPATDPTPRNSLILGLITQDRASALILGRPCYHGLANEPLCNSSLWTNKRYATEIVSSLSEAIEQISKQYRTNEIVLIGHSGGGALAVLIAENIPKVSAVITVGANLNTQGWTQHHNLLPLSGSINPIERPDLPEAIMQKHYVGSNDKIIPVALLQSYTNIHKASELVIIEEFDHLCCWQTIWPEILRQIQ
jgi:predicted alpha/beta hydrolase family esterase